jgi:hypothetical protein
LKEKGFHYLDEGKELIQLILSQMNNHRLSTSGSREVDPLSRKELYLKINGLLSSLSNYENIGGKRFIRSLNRYEFTGKTAGVVEVTNSLGSVIFSSESRAKCAKFLSVSERTVGRRIEDGKGLNLNGELVFIKNVSAENASDGQ